MRVKSILIIVILLCILQGCSNDSEEISFEVYLGKADLSNLKKYVISEEPLFTDRDIKAYDWKTHRIIFKKEFLNQKATQKNSDETKTYLGGSKLLNTNSRDRFIVYVNKEPIYEGFYMQSVLSSFYPVGATMVDVEGGVQITFNQVEGSQVMDKRNDERIYNSLNEKKILNKK